MSHDYSQQTLEDARAIALLEIENWWTSVTQDVFDSAALGTMYRYWCGVDDQMRMVNGALSKESTVLMATPHPVSETPFYSWTPHTARQASVLHADYTAFVALSYDQYISLQGQLAAATSWQECQDIVNLLFHGTTTP